MLWFWGLCGAFAFSAGPLGVTLFGEVCARKKYAAAYTFMVSLVTGGIFAQVFGDAFAQLVSSGVTVNGMHMAFRLNSVGGAASLGVGCNAWWPILVKRVGGLIDGGGK